MGQELFAELRPHLVSAFTVITYDQRDRGETASATGDGGLQSAPARNDALMRRFAATRAFDTCGRLAAIVARTLVVHGRDDAVVPIQDALAMAGEITHADVLVLAGAGHAWENDQPARAASAIAAFLADTRRPQSQPVTAVACRAVP
ncbi:alpha/beta fold hydrolase [Micromonospora olivasterospora]|uniref:alpha/beta fold hydrolase n=1 Tax=Micromonospora olivasterospora TaxID=1880 RepID=UPI0014783F4E|nr:alpha/beta hydrolase [Micromonospora olivasterospora]